MGHPTDDRQPLFGRESFHARGWRDLCHRAVGLLWAVACAVLVSRRRNMHGGLVRRSCHIRFVYGSTYY